MKRAGVSAVLLALTFAGGCAGPAKYVEKRGDAGIVAIPNNTDTWPNHYRTEALALIQKHVGANYEILEEREVVVGQATTNNQQVNTEQTVNRDIPFLPAEKQTITNTTTQRDLTEWRIVYRRKDVPTSSIAPVGGQVPANNVVPSVLPAGGPSPVAQPRPGAPRTSSYMARPAGAANPADCDH